MSGYTPGSTFLDDEPPSLTARIFDSWDSPADVEALGRLAHEVQGVDLAAPPAVMPDFHQERNMEAPCSIAVATRETIRPRLNNASVNCGMALIALDAQRPDGHAMTEFFRRVRERLPHPPSYHRELSTRDVVRAAIEGSLFAVDRFGVDPRELDRVEEGGRLELDPYGGSARLRRELPQLSVQLSRLQFGTVGPSNHFVELQEVVEVLDPATATLLGLSHGQLTLQYHAGGGVLTGLVGRMFGRRTDFPRRHRAIMGLQKPIHHLASARSRSEFRLRTSLYFSDGCPAVPRRGTEGERMMLANAGAMNYGFAYRLAVYSHLRRFAKEALGAHGSQLVVDSPHDTLYEEMLDGDLVLMHRYKTARAFPASRMGHHPVFGVVGQPLLLPGTNRTSSYLCVADEGAAKSLYSACHGTGTIISAFEASGRSGADPLGRSTLRYGYSDAAPTEVAHLDDQGIDEALRILTRHRIVRPVARLNPIAVLT
jgi:tRNA-splicing ligase RtcB